MIKTILAGIPTLTDSTSFYRGFGPLCRLSDIIPWIQVQIADKINWCTVGTSDLIFLQRPCNDSHLKLAQDGKKNNKPVWIDFDDNLLDVPLGNPSYHFYAQSETKDYIRKICETADIITTSTEHLGTIYSQFNKNIKVIPNAFDDSRFIIDNYNTPGTNLAWRGSNTHDRDMLAFTDNIASVHNKLNCNIYFFGAPYFGTVDRCIKEKIFIVKFTEIISYFYSLKKIRPKIIFVPLEDNLFNKSKSNIVWIEATFAGSVVVAPNWDEWKKPGIINYENHREFENKIINLYKNDNLVMDNLLKSIDYIKNNLLLSHTNKLRSDIIKKLLNIND